MFGLFNKEVKTKGSIIIFTIKDAFPVVSRQYNSGARAYNELFKYSSYLSDKLVKVAQQATKLAKKGVPIEEVIVRITDANNKGHYMEIPFAQFSEKK